MHPLVHQIKLDLRKAGDPSKAAPMQAYMKTHQPFYGVQAGPRRKLFKAAIRSFPITNRKQYETCVCALWQGEYREEMYQAIELAQYYNCYHDENAWPLFESMVYEAPHWDTLDWIAGKLISPLVRRFRHFETNLRGWRCAESFWVRRASLLAHLHHGLDTNTALLAETILELASEKEFFIRKAIGWVLRDFAYSDPQWVLNFVSQNQTVLSGLSQREALKHIER